MTRICFLGLLTATLCLAACAAETTSTGYYPLESQKPFMQTDPGTLPMTGAEPYSHNSPGFHRESTTSELRTLNNTTGSGSVK